MEEKIIKMEEVDQTGGYCFITKKKNIYRVFVGNINTRWGMDGSVDNIKTKNRALAYKVFNDVMAAQEGLNN